MIIKLIFITDSRALNKIKSELIKKQKLYSLIKTEGDINGSKLWRLRWS